MIEDNLKSITLQPREVLQEIGLRERMRVGDLGCGAAGHYVFPVARLVGPRGHVYAVDVQKRILEALERRARVENLNNVDTVWSDIESRGATKIEPATLDMALLINVLYQISDRLAALREAVRLLRIGGRLVAVDWQAKGAPLGPPLEQRVTHSWLEETADSLGLKLLKCWSPSRHHFGLIFEK